VEVYEPWGWVVGTGAYLDRIEEEVSGVRTRVVSIFVFVGLLIVSLALHVARKITGSLGRIAAGVRRMAEGDLSALAAREDTQDEVGVLARDVRKMAGDLGAVIGSIVESSQSVSTAVEIVKSALEKTAQGAQTQVVRASQITASAEEMSQTIVSIAASAQDASANSSLAMNRVGG
jgi:methyl-accepting chemotaxis protein